MCQMGRRPDTDEVIEAVVFDLGAVLIDWDPRRLYGQLFDDEAAMEHFLATVCTPAWNTEQDRGRDLAEATRELVDRFPEQAELISAYYGRWDEMLGDPIAGTVEIAAELLANGVRLVALSNWSAQTFGRARARMTFLDDFDAVVVSGAVGLLKPDPAIYQLLVREHAVDPRRTIFVDDAPANVVAAAELGFDALLFSTPQQLRADLVARGLLGPSLSGGSQPSA